MRCSGCNTCGKVEVCNETPTAEHNYSIEYFTDNEFHWFECLNCDAPKDKDEHIADGFNTCTICNESLGATTGIIYDLSKDKSYAEVIGYQGVATRITIASEYQERPVKVISNGAFSGSTITSVFIPDSITTIGISAFDDCNLQKITMGKNVSFIGTNAFGGCDINDVYISDIASWCNITFDVSTQYTTTNPIYYAENIYLNGELLTNLIIPDGVTQIKDFAFYNCSTIEKVFIPESVTEIGWCAFSKCQKLSSIDFPDTAILIDRSFSDCNSLSLTEENSCIYLGDTDNPYMYLVGISNKNLSTYEINSATKIIDAKVFSGCYVLSEIVIPDSVEIIGYAAFEYCTRLRTITIGCNISYIYNYAFNNCDFLDDVYYSKDVDHWQEINIGSKGNSCLFNANIHYN